MSKARALEDLWFFTEICLLWTEIIYLKLCFIKYAYKPSWAIRLVTALQELFIISACNDTDSWGENCANKCDCGIGADHCDRLTGCVCNQGYNGTYCTENINECLRSPSPCINNQKCVDTEGSYYCTCETGYLIHNETCVGMLFLVYM